MTSIVQTNTSYRYYLSIPSSHLLYISTDRTSMTPNLGACGTPRYAPPAALGSPPGAALEASNRLFSASKTPISSRFSPRFQGAAPP